MSATGGSSFGAQDTVPLAVAARSLWLLHVATVCRGCGEQVALHGETFLRKSERMRGLGASALVSLVAALPGHSMALMRPPNSALGLAVLA